MNILQITKLIGKSPGQLIAGFEPQLIAEYEKLEAKFNCNLSFLIEKKENSLIVKFLTEQKGVMRVLGEFKLKEIDLITSQNSIE